MIAQLNKVTAKKLELKNGDLMWFMVADMMLPQLGYVENIYINKKYIDIPELYDDSDTIWGYKSGDNVIIDVNIQVKDHKFKAVVVKLAKG